MYMEFCRWLERCPWRSSPGAIAVGRVFECKWGQDTSQCEKLTISSRNESRPRVPFSVFIKMRGFKILPMASPRVVELPQQVGQVHLLGFGASLWLFGGAKCAVRAAIWRSCMRSALSFKHFQTFQHWKYSDPIFNLTVVRLKQRVNILAWIAQTIIKRPSYFDSKTTSSTNMSFEKREDSTVFWGWTKSDDQFTGAKGTHQLTMRCSCRWPQHMLPCQWRCWEPYLTWKRFRGWDVFSGKIQENWYIYICIYIIYETYTHKVSSLGRCLSFCHRKSWVCWWGAQSKRLILSWQQSKMASEAPLQENASFNATHRSIGENRHLRQVKFWEVRFRRFCHQLFYAPLVGIPWDFSRNTTGTDGRCSNAAGHLLWSTRLWGPRCFPWREFGDFVEPEKLQEQLELGKTVLNGNQGNSCETSIKDKRLHDLAISCCLSQPCESLRLMAKARCF